jgi:hypothetical protein
VTLRSRWTGGIARNQGQGRDNGQEQNDAHPDPAERLARWDLTADEITASPDATARLIKRKPVQENTGSYVVGG